MLHPVIMAGGSGTRFWPESRNQRPKQLLSLAGERTLLQATVDRLTGLAPPERMLIVTNARLVDEIARQLPELPAASVLGEPCKRDTAPCIGLAALHVSRDDPDATMLVAASDHVIEPRDAFQQSVRLAERLVDEQPGRIVTFGIPPNYPAEVFGYIERGERLNEKVSGTISQRGPTHSGLPHAEMVPDNFSSANAPSVYRVQRFREKPPVAVAREYLASGNFYWNSGIFVWKARTILQALAERQPEMLAHLKRIDAARGRADYRATLEREFAAIRGVSIDYAVMEHARDVLVIEAPFAWDDLGSWQSLARLRGVDEQGNTIDARHLGLQTTGSIIRGGDEHLIVTAGVSDLIVVHTPDATLVANKHDEEAIRKIAKLLEERGWQEYL